jgi:ferric iron reductase protein FhuF
MTSYYDDNFGHYTIESEEDVQFYRYVQKRSVTKKCKGCGRKVKLLPDYAYCDSCARKLEQGGDL